MADSKMVLEVEANVGSANSNLKSLNGNISDFEKHAGQAGDTANRSFSSFETTLGRVKQALLGVGFIEVGKSIIGLAADFERARIGMEALTGSAAAGNKLFKEVQDFALTSPFQFKDLLVGSNRLMAMGFAADKVLPTLKAISAAGAALNYDSGKMADLTNAFGQIQASGRITGETMRELRHAAIPAVEILGEKFKLTGAQVEDAIEKKMIPGGLAVQALVEGLNEKFGKFDAAVSKTASVAISNLTDAWGKFADSAGSAFLPVVTDLVRKLSNSLTDLGEAIKGKPQDLRDFATAIGEIGVLLVAYKIGGALVGVSTGLEAIGASLAANPLGLLAMGIVGVTIAMHQFSEEYTKTTLQGKKSPLDLLLSQGVRDTVFYGKAAGGLGNTLPTPGMGFAADVMAGKYSPNTDNPYKLDPGKGNADEIRNLEAQTAKEATDERAKALGIEYGFGEKILLQAEAQLAQFRQKGKINNAIAKNVRDKAYWEISAQAATLRRDARKDLATYLGKNAEDSQSLIYRDFQNENAANTDTATLQLGTTRSALEYQQTQAQQSRDAALRNVAASSIGPVGMTSRQEVALKQSIEEQKLAIEVDYLKKTLDLRKAMINADADAQTLEFTEMARVKDLDNSVVAERVKAISEDAQQKVRQMDLDTVDAINAARQDSATRSVEATRNVYEGEFERIKSSAGTLFDSLVSNTKSFGQQLMATLRTAILTPIKEAISTWIAGMLMGGRALTGGGGARSGGGTVAALAGGMSGNIGGVTGSPFDWMNRDDGTGSMIPNQYVDSPVGAMAGMAGMTASSAGGSMAAGLGGSMAGTGSMGMGGSVGAGGGYTVGIGSMTGSGGSSGLGSLMQLAGLKGLGARAGMSGAAGLGMLGIGAGALGIMGGSKLAGMNNGWAKGAGIGIAGLGGAVAGGGLMAMFPALASFGMAVPILGAALGIGVGLWAAFGNKSPEQKMIDAVKDSYGVKIDTAEAKSLVQRAGGMDYRTFIQQASIREEIMLYANMTKQGIGSSLGVDKVARGVNLTESGGSLYQSATYSNGGAYGYQSTLGSLGNFQTLSPNVTAVINLDGRATTNVLGGAAVNATAQSRGRTGLASNLLSPAMGTI